MRDTIFMVLLVVFGLATLSCAVLGVYSLPMGLILKDRKQAMLGFKCLLGAIAGCFFCFLLFALVIGGRVC